MQISLYDLGKIPAETLVIGTWSSKCNNCQKSCDLYAKTHDRIYGYGDQNGTDGCGVEWTHIMSEYIGHDVEQRVKSMRPDLEFIEFKIV